MLPQFSAPAGSSRLPSIVLGNFAGLDIKENSMYISVNVRDDLIKLINLNLSDWQSYLDVMSDVADTDEDECNFNDLTVGLSENGQEWSYQTGDNSFTGGAYSFPHWAVVSFSKDTTPKELIDDLLQNIAMIEVY
jgi:hypothetical protein